jgi:membrane protein
MKQEQKRKKSSSNSEELDFGVWAERVKRKNTVCWYAMEMLRHFFADKLTRASAELSYYLLFSIFPLLVLTSLLLSLTDFSTKTLLKVMVLLPSDVQKLLLPTLTRYLGNYQVHPRYWQIIFFSLFATYFMSRTMSSLMQNVNRMYGVPDARGGIRQFLFEIATAAGLVFALMLSFVLTWLGRGIVELLSSLLELPTWVIVLLRNGRILIVVGFVFLFMLLLCYWMPNCKMKWRDVLPGTIFILCAWVVCTTIFSIYFNNFNRYDVIYGSIGAIMVLLLWLYMSCIVILLGFVVNYITMQRRKRDFIYKSQLRMLRRKKQRK